MSRFIFAVSVCLGFVFLMLPLAIVLPLAFNDSAFLNYPMDGVSLRWFVSPLVVPSVVLGVAMFFIFSRFGLSGGFLSLILAHTVLGAPRVFLSAMTSLKGLNPELDRAGASMGASRLFRFRTIILPLTAPGFLIGALFAFITSFDEVVVALFLSSPQSLTLPIALFAGLRDRLEPTLVVVALMLSILSILFLLVMERLQRGIGRQG